MIHRMTMYQMNLSGEPGDDPEARNFSSTEIITEYTQPFLFWMRYVLYHHVWERVSQPVYKALEPRRARAHSKTCTSCWPEDGDDGWCGYIDRTTSQDIRCFDFQYAKIKTIREIEGRTRDFKDFWK